MNFERDLLKKIAPYKAGEQPQDKNYIKLNTNENPYPPTSNITKLLNGFDIDSLKLYPDPNNMKLKKAIAEEKNVSIDNIFVGNGSDEVLAFIFGTFFESNSTPILFNDITYSFYKVYANLWQLNVKLSMLNDDFTVNMNDFVNANDVSGIFICNPNAPTGIALTKCEVEEIVKTNSDKVVVVDEAYADFSTESVEELINTYENLIVVKTLSKSYSLAGIRCGYALAHKGLINSLNKIKNCFNSYTIDRLCEMVSIEAVKDTKYHKECVERVIKTRERISKKLTEMGFNVLKSSSNFIFCSSDKMYAKDLYEKLKDNGVLVRYFAMDRIDNYLRVTIGTDDEMDKMLDILNKILD